MTFSSFARGAGLALMTAAIASQPALAEKWPGKTPVPGGAVAAKAIGSVCPGILKPGESDELTAYIERYLDTISSRDPQMRERIGGQVLPELERVYTADYAKPGGCGPGATELAQDMLQRVRAVASDAGYWERVLNPPVGPLDAIYAKAVGSACSGTLASADVAVLEGFVKVQMDEFAKTSNEADTAATWAHLRDSETKFAAELRKQDMCTLDVRNDARGILKRVVDARTAK